ncbi:MAG: SH3 domain-containing protein [Cytophagales bacterium]|nr:SH3 domain-containing protein [Cytophagales bacterium]
MSSHLKHFSIVMVAITLFISSCTTMRNSTQTTEIPDSRMFLDSTYRCVVHELPTSWDPELTVSFEKVTQYEFQELITEFEEADNGETRVAGGVTMLTGALLAGIVALGGEDDDGNYIEPNPEAGKGILIGGLVLGGIMAIIPDSKKKISSSVSTKTLEENEAINDQDSVYSVWSNVKAGEAIRRTLVDDEIELDVIEDLGLDYVENKDSIQVYFKSHWDENLLYTVDFFASDYLKRYLNTNAVGDSIAMHQAPASNAPIVGYLGKGDELEFVEEQEDWYKAEWKGRNVYLKTDSIGYFYARE